MRTEDMINFLISVGKLKDIDRKGWVLYDVKNPESVADHSFRTALMCMLLADKNIDGNKAIKMALVHDIAEAEAGDLTPHDISRERKHEKEQLSMNKILLNLNQEIAAEILNLWTDYDKQKSKEAAFVKQIESLEMALQAIEYEKSQNKKLDEFFEFAKKEIKDKNLVNIFNEIVKMRKKHD